ESRRGKQRDMAALFEFHAPQLDPAARAISRRALPLQVLIGIVPEFGPDEVALARRCQALAVFCPSGTWPFAHRGNDEFSIFDRQVDLIVRLGANLDKQRLRNNHAMGVSHLANSSFHHASLDDRDVITML